MAARLNHTIVWCTDKRRSAAFLAEMLGRPEPRPWANFMVVELDNGVSLDFMEAAPPISMQHYAFLVEDTDFDAVMERIRVKRLEHWADPGRTQPDRINQHFGGRGVYFRDPDGHLLEAITTPYGQLA